MSTNKNDPVVPDVVRELIQESRKMEEWIGGLADHADEAYPEVFERVKTDYRGRLDGVTDDLRKHRPDLISSLEARQGTVASHRGDRDSQKADLEEVRLRHAVGEFSEEQWNSRRTTIEASLDKVGSVLATEEDAVSELAAIVDSVDRIVGTVSPPPPISRVVKKTVKEKVASQDRSWSQVVSRMPEKPEKDDAGASDDELAFLESVSTEDFKKFDPINAAFLNGQ